MRLAQAELLAASAVDLAVLRALASQALPEGESGKIEANAQVERCLMVDGGRIAYTLQDAAGQVDLNKATAQTLAVLFEAVGGIGDPAAVVTALLARREREPFRVIEELAYVPGIPPAAYAALAPHVTLHTGYEGLSEQNISPWLVEKLRTLLPPGNTVLGSLPTEETYALRVTALPGSGRAYDLDAVVALEPGRERPYRVLRWVGQPVQARPAAQASDEVNAAAGPATLPVSEALDPSRLAAADGLRPCVTSAIR